MLADEQFNLATKRLDEKLSKMHAEHTNTEKKKFEQEKSELTRIHQSEIRLLEINRDSQLKSIEEGLKKVISDAI